MAAARHAPREQASPYSFPTMREQDIPAVSKLATHIWHAHYPDIISLEQIEYMLERMYSPAAMKEQLTKGHCFTLAYDEGELAGFASVEKTSPDEYFIHKFYIDSTRHRSGIGTRLMQELFTRYTPGTLSLNVNRDNEGAIRFYHRMGFMTHGEKIIDIGQGYIMDDFIMTYEENKGIIAYDGN